MRVTCPECTATLEVADEMLGQPVECGHCNGVFTPTAEDRRSSQRQRDDNRPSRRRLRDDDDDDDDYGYDNRPRQSATTSQDTYAVVSLVLGIVSLFLALGGFFICCPYIGAPFGALAAVFGALGLKSESRGLAIGGLIMGLLSILISIIVTLIVFGLFAVAANAEPPAPRPPNPPGFNRFR